MRVLIIKHFQSYLLRWNKVHLIIKQLDQNLAAHQHHTNYSHEITEHVISAGCEIICVDGINQHTKTTFYTHSQVLISFSIFTLN